MKKPSVSYSPGIKVSIPVSFLGNTPGSSSGSGKKSVPCYKTEQVNGIRMLPQYVWIKGNAVIKELEKAPLL